MCTVLCFSSPRKSREGLLDHKEIKSVNPKGNQQHWIFTGRTDAEAEALILWPPDVKSCLIGKGPDAGKDWREEEKGMTEDEMIGWHHWLNGHEFQQTLGNGRAQRSLAFWSPWGHKRLWVSDWTVMTRRTADLCVNCPTSGNNYFIYSIQVDSWLLHVAKSNTSYLVISRGTISFFLNIKRSMLIPYFKSMYS